MDSVKLFHPMICLFIVQSLILQKNFTKFWNTSLAKRDIELSYNNDGSIFWSKRWLERYCGKNAMNFAFQEN